MSDSRFSSTGEPATLFETELLARCKALEDPWVEISNIVGLDAALAVMDLFASCLLSVPPRRAFVARIHRVWLEGEVLRLKREGMPNVEIAHRLGVRTRTVRQYSARLMRRATPKRA